MLEFKSVNHVVTMTKNKRLVFLVLGLLLLQLMCYAGTSSRADWSFSMTRAFPESRRGAHQLSMERPSLLMMSPVQQPMQMEFAAAAREDEATDGLEEEVPWLRLSTVSMAN